jgi:hypothetical protein
MRSEGSALVVRRDRMFKASHLLAPRMVRTKGDGNL